METVLHRITTSILICLQLICPVPALATDISLPSIGTEKSLMSPEEEKRLGEAFMRMVRQELTVIDDPEVNEYISSLGYGLVGQSDYRNQNFHFFTVQDNTINAFAGPAGYIGVHTGLILTAESESELAAVVAHEIAHVTQRHLDRAFEASDKMGITTMAAILAAIILGSQDANIAEAAIFTTLAANVQSQLNFTRANEREADHIGMQILAQSSYDPHAMPKFFERLQSSDSFGDAVPEFLRTHPVTTSRIAESRNRANQYQFAPRRDSLRFHMIRAKLRVLASNNISRLIRQYESELEAGTYNNELAHRYGYAQALLANNQYDEARKQVKLLVKKDRERISYHILAADIEIAAGNTPLGLKIYEDALILSPSNPVLVYHYAVALLRHGQPHRAKQVLNSVETSRRTSGYLKLLAQAERDSGALGASHRLLGEYYFENGYTRIAIDQLNLALKEEDLSAQEKENIRARIQELKVIALEERNL